MVFVNNKKFACESCIKGHRSSSCSHTDRPLFEVKKKGRPISQCERCRELRQSRRVHSKCTCNDANTKDSSSPRTIVPPPSQASSTSTSSSGTKSKRRFVPIEPALPNGLRDIFQASALAPADIRQKVETLLNPCHCNPKDGRICECPRQPASNSPIKGPSEPGLVTLARAAALCCAPDNIAESSSSSARTQHPDSSKRVSSRPTTPFGTMHKRHKSDVVKQPPRLELPPIFPTSLPISLPTSVPSFATMPPLSAVASLAGSGCTCGLQCACPDCEEHRGPRTSPHCCGKDCNHCVDPSLAMSLPDISGTSSGKSIIDQFFARAAALPSPPSSRKAGGPIIDPMDTTVYPSAALEKQDERGAAFGLVNLPKLECCGGNCGCPYGRCGCGQACDGCCAEHGGEKPADEVSSSHSESSPAGPVSPSVHPQLVRSCCSGRR